MPKGRPGMRWATVMRAASLLAGCHPLAGPQPAER